MTVRLDHLVIAAHTLKQGIDWAEQRLGVPPAGRGAHANMGTHNALWGLGRLYLEVIAIDPDGHRPDRPRWFGFDDPKTQERLSHGPRLLTWAVAVDRPDALATLAGRAPEPHDPPVDLSRNDLRWQVALPQKASLPLDGAWPLTICWTEGHPSRQLPDQGLSLNRLTVYGAGAAAAEPVLGDVEGPVFFTPSEDETRLEAELAGASGVITL